METVKIRLTIVFISIFFATTLFWGLFANPGDSKERPGFNTWLGILRKEALSKGISESTLNKALKDLQPIPQIIERDRNQPEMTLTLEKYLSKMVSDSLVKKGQEKLAEHRALLTEISVRYHVQAQFLMALWGIETHFGRLTGDFPILAAVATLAYDGRRSTFFRKELLHALRIIDEGHITVEKMRGSWAGAMGQVQFMPSSFRHYAVDYNKDGRIDIWNSLGDIFASAANYLSRSGWKAGQLWGMQVRLPKSFDRGLIDIKIKKSLNEWQLLGVRQIGNRKLPQKQNMLASIVEPDGPTGRAFLVYHNYRVILKWNQSHFFGVAVGILADRILGQ